MQRVEIVVGVFVHIVAQHLLQASFHGVAFRDERVAEAADQRARRQRAHVLGKAVRAVLVEAEGARRRQRQRHWPVVVVVRRVVVERRRRARPLLATCAARDMTPGARGTGDGGTTHVRKRCGDIVRILSKAAFVMFQIVSNSRSEC